MSIKASQEVIVDLTNKSLEQKKQIINEIMEKNVFLTVVLLSKDKNQPDVETLTILNNGIVFTFFGNIIQINVGDVIYMINFNNLILIIHDSNLFNPESQIDKLLEIANGINNS